jgi:hypothetical protein
MAELALLFATVGEAVGTAAVAGGEALAGVADTAAAAAGGPMALLGTGLQVAGAIGQGLAAKKEGKFAEEAYKRQGTEELAEATRQAEERRQKTALVLSRERAVAADSGAGVTNPTILDIMGDTAQRGEYQAGLDLFSGKNKAAGSFDKAAAAKYKGNAAFAGSILEGLGKGATGLAKYG